MARRLDLHIVVYDELGIIEIAMPDGSTWTGRKADHAINFIRREMAYRTAPTSSIWKDQTL